MTSEPTPPFEGTALWALAGFGFAVLASPVMAWELFGEPPLWAVVSATISLALGMACWVVATVLKGRTEQVSAIRIVGRALWAPIRFISDFTF